MSLKEEMKNIRAERETLSKKIQDMVGAVFAEEAKKLFETHSRLQSFSWTQYTPYFNDGEECRFSVHTDYLTLTDVDGNEDECGAWGIRHQMKTGTDWQGNPYTPSELELLSLPVADFLEEFENEDFLMMFGDHVRITVYRDGRVETDECQHD